MRIGIDFGTTNSAVALAGPDGSARILPLVPGEATQRTVIYAGADGRLQFGNAAFQAYLEADLQGRFLRSLKAFLGDDIPSTTLGHGRYAFVELIATYLRFLIGRAEAIVGERVEHVTFGRPVVFNRDPGKDARALATLETAIGTLGLPSYSLELEPIAAALQYEASLTEERIVLVGDFGGGTSDFALLRVGPERRVQASRRGDVLGTAGVPLAGDALDSTFVTRFLLPYFGKHAPFDDRGQVGSWDPDVLRHVPKLYDIHRHREPRLAEHLDRMEDRVHDRRVVRRLRRLVFDDLGYPLAQAVEGTKRRFSASKVATFRFDEFYSDALTIELDADRDEMRDAASATLGRYVAAIESTLAQAGLPADRVDEVFLTGGTSQLPFVRGVFADLFGAGKLRSGDAFTSVCEGLALSAGTGSSTP